MKKKCYGNIQRQVTSLVPIIEFCLALKAEVELTEINMNNNEIVEATKNLNNSPINN